MVHYRLFLQQLQPLVARHIRGAGQKLLFEPKPGVHSVVVNQRLQQVDDEVGVAQEVPVMHKHPPQQRPELQAALHTSLVQLPRQPHVHVESGLQQSAHLDHGL